MKMKKGVRPRPMYSEWIVFTAIFTTRSFFFGKSFYSDIIRLKASHHSPLQTFPPENLKLIIFLLHCHLISSQKSEREEGFQSKGGGLRRYMSMGLIALVKFLAQSFDHFAWPVITLVYPLYASIRAIESNCNTQSRKWLTYWILFALILLSEVTVVKINQWLPVWHHIKLIATFWLVVPHSDGAFYVYENILRPCFYVNPKTFVQWFKIRKEEFQVHRTDDFLLLAERYIEENGSQSLEKLITKSPSLCMEHNHAVVRTEMEAVTTATMEVRDPGSQSLEKLIKKSPSLCMEHNHAVVRTEMEAVTTAITEVNAVEPNILRIETKAKEEDKVAEAAAAASGKCALDPKEIQKEWACALDPKESQKEWIKSQKEWACALDPKESQKEWACAICQVTTTCESNLTDHLNGMRHKAKEEERLANMTPTKNRNSSYHLPKTGSTKLVGVLKGTGSQVEQYNKARNVSVAEAKKDEPKKDSKKAQSTNVRIKGKALSQVEQMNKKKNKVLRNQSSELWCDTCKLMCGSQTTLTAHLNGKKHLNRLNESMTGTSEHIWEFDQY